MIHPHVHTINGITVVLDGKTYDISNKTQNYVEIVRAVQDGCNTSRVLECINRFKKKVEDYLRLSIALTYRDGCIYFHDKKLHGYAVRKLIALIEAGQPTTALANFLTKVQSNPLQEVIDHLYQFLEHGQMPITPTGDFIAYKAVRNNWYDIHSGNFYNGLGSFIQMPRKDVDTDRNQTCSYGFHVCSFDYLPHFSHSNGHVVLCQVNPADVVAIPADYNDTKMRVSAYHVVDEHKGYYTDKTNILAETPVWDTTYTVWIKDEAEDAWFQLEEVDYYETLEEAVHAAVEEFDWAPREIKVLNSKGTEMMHLKKD